MSGESDPVTRAEATSGPRATPVLRIPGSTAAAWLSVNGMVGGPPGNRPSNTSPVSIGHGAIDLWHRQVREGRKDGR
ncbi:hypothetical protein GCM10010249_50420 [Streptomyces roseolilacinus]|uniref:Uncharacterized protein n=1 Tax=Streptomyces roseolilacinus TaxID=66904 RepID=A0A918B430_9ACTN|nr:hypothetical protein GCM10010249_50420 [Streptomyces roseolilacinus]